MAPARTQLRRGVVADDPVLRATQERLKACACGMAHPDRDEIVPACVQPGVLDPPRKLDSPSCSERPTSLALLDAGRAIPGSGPTS